MNKQVSVLAAIAILAIGLGVWLSQAPSKEPFATQLLFEDLQKFANQLDSVEIKNEQGVLFSAQKSTKGWLATFDPEQAAYPIAQDKLAEFVETMMRARLVEAKTSKPKNYFHLGLQPIDTQDSMANLVTFKANEKSWQVLVGNRVSLGEGHYILKPDNAQSWRIDKNISLPIDKFSWLRQPILPFQVQDISSISRVDSLNWQIARSANGDLQLLNQPKDRELEYANVLNSVFSNLISLNFEQILAAHEVIAQSLKILTQLEVVTTENKIFQVVISEQDDKHFVNFSSNEQSEYWQNGYYQVSNFSAQQLIKTLDDFLEEQSPTKIISENNTKPKTVDEGESPY